MPTDQPSDGEAKLHNPATRLTDPAAPTPSNAGGSLRLQAGGRPLPEYELLRKLGAGGFGEVWQARGPGGIDVALKFIRLDAGGSHLELRSLDMMKSIRHPNLVSLFGAWHKGDTLILAMELCDGSMQDRLKEARARNQPGIPVVELLDYMRDAARGIDLLNDKHIQHRDIKPLNLLVVENALKVGDFGLAKILDRSVASNTGSMTPHYAAPECFKGAITRQSDQYSLAVTYYQLRTGKLPFDGSFEKVMYGHLTVEPDLARLPPAEREAVARALAKEPGQRYASCQAFVLALADAHGAAVRLQESAPLTQSDNRRTVARPADGTSTESRRRPWVAAMLLLVALACGGIFVGGLTLGVLPWFAGDKENDLVRGGPDVDASKGPPDKSVSKESQGVEDKKGTKGPKVDGSKVKGTPSDKSEEPKSPATPKNKEANSPDELPKALVVDLGSGATMEFVLIRSGKFWMGSPKEEEKRNPFEKEFDAEELHEVEISKPFYLAKFPTTQQQYEAMTRKTPSHFSATGSGKKKVDGLDTKRFPVENVSWDDAKLFCALLTNKATKGRKFSLPTEAEWEYACRAGTKTAFHFGDFLNGDKANCNGEHPYGAAIKGDDKGRTCEVGSYPPNAWGLCDMHGNVWQWCEDFFGHYQDLGNQDPLRTISDKWDFRVLRGGCWKTEASYCRAARRGRFAPARADNGIGFRVAFRSVGKER